MNRRLLALLSLLALGLAASPAEAKVMKPERIWLNLSIFPPLDLASRYDVPVIPRLSLNLLGGYVYALEGLELGGIMNAEAHHVIGAQLATGGNFVDGTVLGFQGTLGLNAVEGAVGGMQLAFILNRASRGVVGAQLGGCLNMANRSMYGLQGTSMLNLVQGETVGVQMGAVNVTTGKVKGLQIGLLNYADELEGVPIGLFSYVRQGRLAGSLGIDTRGTARATLASGGALGYSVLSIGYRTSSQAAELLAGLGGRRDFTPVLFREVELLGGAYLPAGTTTVLPAALLRTGLGYRWWPHVTLKAGGSLLFQLPSAAEPAGVTVLGTNLVFAPFLAAEF